MMTSKRPDRATKAVTSVVVGALRSAVRKVLSSRRAPLVVGVVVAAALGFVVTSALYANGPHGGVVVQAPPSLVSYHRQGNPNERANAGTEGHFTIAGNASQVLYPGTTSPIDLEFTNKTGTAITLPAKAITITITSPRTSCPSSPNFAVVQTLASTITIPKDATGESLSDMGITPKDWPVVSMVTTHVNQDACEGMTLALHYSATVTTTKSVTAGTTGSGSGSPGGGGSSVPVKTATAATSGGALAFTGLDDALFVGIGGVLVLSGIALLTWRRRVGVRR